jgi:hypothetical protein
VRTILNVGGTFLGTEWKNDIDHHFFGIVVEFWTTVARRLSVLSPAGDPPGAPGDSFSRDKR